MNTAHSPLEAPVATGTPLFDPQLALASLESPELLAEAVDAFIGMYDGLAQETRAAFDRRDWPALQMSVHSWKGACLYVGASAVSSTAATLEAGIAEGHTGEVPAQLRRFETMLAQLQAELTAWHRAEVQRGSRS